jgi:hypothetical protein
MSNEYLDLAEYARRVVARWQELNLAAIPGSFTFNEQGEKWLDEAMAYALPERTA